jgi:hypothetical protein
MRRLFVPTTRFVLEPGGPDSSGPSTTYSATVRVLSTVPSESTRRSSSIAGPVTSVADPAMLFDAAACDENLHAPFGTTPANGGRALCDRCAESGARVPVVETRVREHFIQRCVNASFT